MNRLSSTNKERQFLRYHKGSGFLAEKLMKISNTRCMSITRPRTIRNMLADALVEVYKEEKVNVLAMAPVDDDTFVWRAIVKDNIVVGTGKCKCELARGMGDDAMLFVNSVLITFEWEQERIDYIQMGAEQDNE